VGLVTTAGAGTVIAPVARAATRRQVIIGIVYLVLAAIVGLVLTSGIAGSASSSFGLNPPGKPAVVLPSLVVPSIATLYLISGLLAFLGAVQLSRGFGSRWAIVLAVVVITFIFAVLVWVAAGKSMSLIGILQTTVQRAVPIVFGAMSGVLCERAGVVNIAIEGMLLTGAFVGAVVGSAFDNIWLGLGAAGVVGGLLALLLAILAIRYVVDQIIAGTVINIFAVGITSFLYTRVLSPQQSLNQPDRFPLMAIPVLSDIPIIGPMFFNGSLFLYLAIILVGLIHYALFYTRWGLRVRAVGEHPRAADTVGIDVLRTRYRNVILGGIVAGIGGAYFTLGSTGSFEPEMTAGRGFIGLAAMIFGAWTPIGAFLASLVFGFADTLQARFSILNVQIPSEFLLMLPYVITIIVVAGLVGRVRAPAADGRPYKKG
jgi:simple sugar transport system permease protein